MHSFIFFLGSLYIFIGAIFLLVPLIYLELGRPKDLIKAFLNLSIGFILIIKNSTISKSLFVIFLLITVLVFMYLVELFLFRWNQLTDKEKNKLTTLSELKNNFSKISDAVVLGANAFKDSLNFFKFDKRNQTGNKKKWVRNDKNDNIKV